MILVTGGVRAGKSRVAHSLCAAQGSGVLYIGTAVTIDEITAERIRRSRQQRAYDWDVYEGFKDLGTVLEETGGKYDAILIESLPSLVTELINVSNAANPGESYRERERRVMEEINVITQAARRIPPQVVFVTNETSGGFGGLNASQTAAMEILGRVNQYVAALCREVYFVVSGIAVKIK